MFTLLKKAALGLALAGAVSAAAAQTSRDAVAANFAEADANADGALTIDEFTRFIDLNAEDRLGNASRIQRTGRYATAFERLDSDKNGLVTREDIAARADQ